MTNACHFVLNCFTRQPQKKAMIISLGDGWDQIKWWWWWFDGLVLISTFTAHIMGLIWSEFDQFQFQSNRIEIVCFRKARDQWWVRHFQSNFGADAEIWNGLFFFKFAGNLLPAIAWCSFSSLHIKNFILCVLSNERIILTDFNFQWILNSLASTHIRLLLFAYSLIRKEKENWLANNMFKTKCRSLRCGIE